MLKSNAFHIILGCTLGIGLIFFESCDDGSAISEGASDRTSTQSRAMSVRAVEAELLPLNLDLNATGTFQANESVEITSEYPGSIREIYFCEGCQVDKGEILISLDQRDIRARIKQLEVDIELAQTELDRARKLRSIQAISQEELQQKEHRLKSLEAEKNILEVQQSKMIIRAPFDGTVGLRRVSPGSYIQPGTVITTLKQIDPIRLEFDVPEEYAHTLTDGDTVYFISSQSRESKPAVIFASTPSIERTTRSRTYLARADNSQDHLLPGGYADVSYAPNREKRALLVPAEAILQEVRGQVVYKVVNDKARKQAVDIGVRTQNAVELKSGVSRGDTIMITGLLNVSDGMPVRVTLENILEKE